ncbi:MAG TPA: hypothetical protein VFV10_17015 [Gammaproteobacteria bacterium]|nr:hypothetical protein [Gammaproteobacteria bacterium]
MPRASAPFVGISLICAFFVAAVSGIAAAQGRYSWELSGLGSTTDNGITDSDASTFGATYYFDRVQDGEGPYALSAFFDPATSLSVVTDQYRTSDRWVLSGHYLLDGSRWYLGGRYQTQDYRDDVYGVIAGKYLGPRTTLELAVDTSKQTFGISPACVALCPRGSIRTNTTTLSFAHVRNFRSLTYTLSGGFTRGEVPSFTADTTTMPFSISLGVDPFRTYSIGAALYPTKKLGLQIGYDRNSGKYFTNDSYSLGARWFFRRNVAFELSLSNLDLHLPEPYGQQETRSFRITGRF